MKKMKRVVPAMLTLVLTAGVAALSAGAASAAPAGSGTPATGPCPDGVYGTCAFPGTYYPAGTGGLSLVMESEPSVGYGIGYVPVDNKLSVTCQVNDGSTDPADGRYETTWDYVTATLSDGTTATGWVYDSYVDTPPQDADGWSLTAKCDIMHPDLKKSAKKGSAISHA